VLPSDLTALFSNLLWSLPTLCIGSDLVTRPYRPEHAGQGKRGTASGSRGAHARSQSAADKSAADELVVEPLAALPPVDWSADTLPSRRRRFRPGLSVAGAARFEIGAASSAGCQLTDTVPVLVVAMIT
jgi:hypothetical protein